MKEHFCRKWERVSQTVELENICGFPHSYNEIPVTQFWNLWILVLVLGRAVLQVITKDSEEHVAAIHLYHEDTSKTVRRVRWPEHVHFAYSRGKRRTPEAQWGYLAAVPLGLWDTAGDAVIAHSGKVVPPAQPPNNQPHFTLLLGGWEGEL